MIAASTALPLFYLIVRAFDASSGAWALVFRTETLWLSARTLGLTGAVVASALALALPLAYLTTRTDLPARRFFSIALALPLAFPSYLGAYALVALFAPGGFLPHALPFSIYGFFGAWLALTLFTFPYLLLPLQAALVTADTSQEEAARTLGATRFEAFRLVTLPSLRPALWTGSLLIALYTISDFGAVSLLRFDTFTRVIYTQFESSLDRGSTAALALVLVAIALPLLFASGRRERPSVSALTRRDADASALGRWRVPSTLFCGCVLGASLVLPTAVIGSWTLRASASAGNSQWRQLWEAGLNSFQVSLGAGIAATALAIPIALHAAKRRSMDVRGIERIAYLGFGVPGVVVGLALVFFGVGYARWAYQTLGLLIFAYVIRFLPQALSAQKPPLVTLSPTLGEAARTLGARPWEAYRRITLPISAPGIYAGFALVFLTSMKELPCTLILSPLDFHTLATRVWSHSSEAAFDTAAPAALLLLSLSAVPMIVTSWLGMRRAT